MTSFWINKSSRYLTGLEPLEPISPELAVDFLLKTSSAMNSLMLRPPEYGSADAEFLEDCFRAGMIAAIARLINGETNLKLMLNARFPSCFVKENFVFNVKINIARIWWRVVERGDYSKITQLGKEIPTDPARR